MSKLRRPDSVEDAVVQAIALLSASTIAMALSARGLRVSESLVAKWADFDAPQKPSLEQALALEGLLIKTGHAPIFVDLFTRLQPLPPETAAAEPQPLDPVREAMHVTSQAATLMEKVDRSMVDGVIDRAELGSIDKLLAATQRQTARLRRVIRSASAAVKPRAEKGRRS